MTSILQLFVAAQKTFVRDRMALFWTLAFPVLFILLFGVIFSGSGQDPVAVGVVRPAGSRDAPDPVLAALGSIPALEVSSGTRDDLLDRLAAGDLRVVVNAPPTLATDVASGRTAEVEVIFDPTSASAREIAVPSSPAKGLLDAERA
jgi:ABC-2 type transport system permease protein